MNGYFLLLIFDDSFDAPSTCNWLSYFENVIYSIYTYSTFTKTQFNIMYVFYNSNNENLYFNIHLVSSLNSTSCVQEREREFSFSSTFCFFSNHFPFIAVFLLVAFLGLPLLFCEVDLIQMDWSVDWKQFHFNFLFHFNERTFVTCFIAYCISWAEPICIHGCTTAKLNSIFLIVSNCDANCAL